MQIKSLFSRWTQVAGVLLMGGALAWTIKLCIIIATNGRIINTGAAALLMKVGIVLLFVGSTGIGNRLSRNHSLWLRIISIILSPIVVFGSLLLLGAFIVPIFQHIDLWYAQEEAPIALAVLVCMPIGYILYKSYRSVATNQMHQS
jgi:hypothetical protein